MQMFLGVCAGHLQGGLLQINGCGLAFSCTEWHILLLYGSFGKHKITRDVSLIIE